MLRHYDTNSWRFSSICAMISPEVGILFLFNDDQDNDSRKDKNGRKYNADGNEDHKIIINQLIVNLLSKKFLYQRKRVEH